LIFERKRIQSLHISAQKPLKSGDNNMDAQYQKLNESFEQIYHSLKRDLSRIRTGRANINILDGLKVNYYNQMTAVSQIAAIQVPEARLITIKPWENNMLKEIEKAVINSDLGLTPSNDGTLIRLQIPPLTEERRKDLVKQVQKIAEAARVSARNHRRDINADLKKLQDAKIITEDDLEKALKKTQTMTDQAIVKIDEILNLKQKELLEV
jgi:ribosome recycling factor